MDKLNNGTEIGAFSVCSRATKAMLEKLKGTGEAQVEHYLLAENSCSFEFPFQEYDGLEAGQIFARVNYFFRFPNSLINTNHVPISFLKGFEGVGLIKLEQECPLTSKLRHTAVFRLDYQKFDADKKLKISASCACCGTEKIFEKHEAEQVCEIIKTKEPADYNEEIAKRIMQTYEQ